MPPKKPPPKGETVRAVGATCGLYVDFPAQPWDDSDNLSENWGGDLAVSQPVDPSLVFADPDFPPSALEGCFGTHVKEWRRPGAIFSPFMPAVCRVSTHFGNPYEYDPAKFAHVVDDEEQPAPRSRDAMIKQHRTMRPFAHFPEPPPAAAADALPSQPVGLVGTPVKDHGLSELSVLDSPDTTSPTKLRKSAARLRLEKASMPTPNFMKAFNSALMIVSQCQTMIPAGAYAWELIYPHQAGPFPNCPAFNPFGKYAVKLFIGGAYRRIVIDDKLPCDSSGHSLLTVTEHKEIWPALLAKAMMKALGPRFESVVLTSPASVVQMLLPGWTPQSLNPRTQPMEVLSATVAFTNGQSDASREQLMLCATCGDSASRQNTLSQSASFYAAKGLVPCQMYFVAAVATFKTTMALRLIGPRVSWKGSLAYSGPGWDAEVEGLLNFRLEDRNAYEVNKLQWVDFWLTWEEFEKTFGSLVVFRNALDKRFASFKQFGTVAQEAVAAPTAKGAKADAGAAQQVTAGPSTLVKWLYAKPDVPAQVLVEMRGYPKHGIDDNKTTLSIFRYDWASPCPLSFVQSLVCSTGVSQGALMDIPAGAHAYKLVAESIEPGCSVTIMGSIDVTLGDEREICQGLMQISQLSDAGVFPAHAPNQVTIWFKRFISVKSEVTANMVLSTLPRTADLAAHRTVTLETAAAAGAKKPPPKAAKGGPAVADLADGLDEKDHDIPIMRFARLLVLNLDTMESVHDTVGKLLNLKMSPNKNGYIVMGHADTGAHGPYGKGLWKLTCASDRPIDVYEPRSCEDLVVKSSEYFHNDHSALFRYHFTALEAATGCIQLNLSEQWGIPFTLQLFHNDKEIFARQGVKRCFIEHMAFIPTDKTAVSTYALHCTLDNKFTQEWEERRRVQVVNQFQRECAEQEAQLMAKQKQLRDLLMSDATSSTSAAVQEAQSQLRPASAVETFAISFALSLHLSTNKVELREDNTIVEHLNSVKASWGKRESEGPAGQPVAAKQAKPAKGQVVLDDTAVRQQKAKDSRERYLTNKKGIFLPSTSKDGSRILNFEDDPLLRLAPILKPAEHSMPQPRSSPFKPTISIPPTDDTTIAALPPPAPAAAPALGPYLQTVFRAEQVQLLDGINAWTAECRQSRKNYLTQLQDSVQAFWHVQRPDKAAPTEGVVEDDKTKPKPKGGKGK
jgi:hypothetical protein